MFSHRGLVHTNPVSIFLLQLLTPFLGSKVYKILKIHTYSRVHISSNEVFSKILKKPSIVQKWMIWKPNWFSLGKNKIEKPNDQNPKNKKGIFQLRQFSIYPTNPWNICKKILRIGGAGKLTFCFVFGYWDFIYFSFIFLSMARLKAFIWGSFFLHYAWFLQNVEKGFIPTM